MKSQRAGGYEKMIPKIILRAYNKSSVLTKAVKSKTGGGIYSRKMLEHKHYIV